MAKITDEMRKEYVDDFGVSCPFCHSEDIEAGSWDFGVGEFWQDVRCNSCRNMWVDIYRLTGVEEYER